MPPRRSPVAKPLDLRRMPCVAWLLSCLLSVGASDVLAQESSGGAPDESTDAPLERRAREITAQATVRFEAGDYSAAAAAFLEAYDLLQGDARQAALLNNVAVSYERMYRYDLAMVYYERYLRESQRDEADREEVRALVAGLRGLLGQVRIRTNVPATVWVGRELELDAPGEVWIPAGTHTIEASASGYETLRQQLRVAPRSTQTLDLTLAALPQYTGIRPHYFWAGAGLTAVALVTATAFGARAVREHRQAEERLDADLVIQGDNQTIQRLQLSADISFGVAALLGVSTLVLFFVSDFERPARPDGRPSRVAVVPEAGLQHWGVRVATRLR